MSACVSAKVEELRTAVCVIMVVNLLMMLKP